MTGELHSNHGSLLPGDGKAERNSQLYIPDSRAAAKKTDGDLGAGVRQCLTSFF